jgi:hypothetical protein
MEYNEPLFGEDKDYCEGCLLKYICCAFKKEKGWCIKDEKIKE